MSTSYTTPLIFSDVLSQTVGCDVYLKLETLQPSYSFKYRGMLHFIQHVKQTKGTSAHIVIASSGNAAIAAACAAKGVGLRCTTFMPADTPPAVVDYIRRQGAEAHLEGVEYYHALKAAERFVEDDSSRTIVSSYNHELLWEGHSTIVLEIASQLPAGVVPDSIICAVGGGGLMGGILTGCQRVGWNSVPIVSLETHGAASFFHAFLINSKEEHQIPTGATITQPETDGPKLVTLEAIKSRAQSLGARCVAPGVLKMALAHPGGVTPVSVRDEDAMLAALEFADQQKILVELACATAMTPAYNLLLAQRLFGNGSQDSKRKTVVFILCGGFKIITDDLISYREHLQSGNQDQSPILVNGHTLG
ncbi:tryptophan synthase beta subunit-like PLP-dependent enzyme [Auriculariales sp. MPI-PUGE-AT-0066]|nr:tryptophan synthase beta subunit-like PLP-dependent enzyme [Auriculariales sp. MPI-PUGE-AT-0066]